MDRKTLIGIAIAALVLLVIFGHNPMDDMRKKMQAKRGEALVKKITEHTQKEGLNGGMFGGGPAASRQAKGSVDPRVGLDTSEDIEPGQTSRRRGMGGWNSGNTSIIRNNTAWTDPQSHMQGLPTNPYLQGGMPTTVDGQRPTSGGQGSGQGGQQQPSAAPAKQDDYYPPPADATKVGPQSFLPPLFHGWHGMTLQSGQPVVFAGTKAYTIDPLGHSKPLPDGRYSVFGGAMIMLIQGGQKTMMD